MARSTGRSSGSRPSGSRPSGTRSGAGKSAAKPAGKSGAKSAGHSGAKSAGQSGAKAATGKSAQPAKSGSRPSGSSRPAATRSSGWSAAEHNQASGRQQRLLTVAIAAGAVVVVVLALVLVKSLTGGDSSKRESGSATRKAIAAATGVPAAALNQAGAGDAAFLKGRVAAVRGTPVSTGGSKPAVVYYGAEYCPFCAAQRWPLVIALSRFGKFSGLQTTTSAGKPEVHPNTPTFTFVKATYTSSYLAFDPVESADRAGQQLQKPSALQTRLVKTYDKPPYVSSDSAGSIPFLYVGGKYVSVGASYDQAPLDGQSLGTIASSLKDPSSPIGKGIGGAANVLTAAICAATNGQPGSVCTASGVKAAAAQLPAASAS